MPYIKDFLQMVIEFPEVIIPLNGLENFVWVMDLVELDHVLSEVFLLVDENVGYLDVEVRVVTEYLSLHHACRRLGLKALFIRILVHYILVFTLYVQELIHFFILKKLLLFQLLQKFLYLLKLIFIIQSLNNLSAIILVILKLLF